MIDISCKTQINSKEYKGRIALSVRHGLDDIRRNDDEAAHSKPTDDCCIFFIDKSGAFEGVVPRDDFQAGGKGKDIGHQCCKCELIVQQCVEHCDHEAAEGAEDGGEDDQISAIEVADDPYARQS